MSNIGYAVFGSPKGIAVVSNGLFKELNLDKSLYLNSSHVSLEKRQQVLMLRRVPSNLNNLEKKDALLVVLYEQALQYGENRPGGFVGSAICFREKMPNSEKMISGLLYLFSKMKENVDADNRFKGIDASNWNISLPDTNKEFGMFKDEDLTYLPLSDSKKNIATKVYNLEKESPSLLSNFALNRSFHEVDYLYASHTASVVQNLTQKGLLSVDFNSLFNYNRHLDYYHGKITHESGRLRDLQYSSSKLENKIQVDTSEANRLASELISKQSKIERIDQNILEIEQQLKNKKQELHEAERDVYETRRLGNPNSKNDDAKVSKLTKKVEELRSILADARKTIEEYTNFEFTEFNDVPKAEENKFIVEHYFRRLPERKSKVRKRNNIILGILLLAVLSCLGLYIFETWSHKVTIANHEAKVNTEKKKKESIAAASKNKAEEQRRKLFENIQKYNKTNSSTADYKKFRTHAETLLANFMEDKYKDDSEESKFIKSYQWEFWEFDYKNAALVQKLGINGDTYFVNLGDKKIKNINKRIPWEGESKISELLKNYLDDEDNNDIYQNIDESVLNDSQTLETHFKWVIEKANKKPSELKENEKIGLPYFKK